MKLFINDHFLVEGTIAAVREALPDVEGISGWYNTSVKSWNTFYKRVELRDQNDNLWGLEL